MPEEAWALAGVVIGALLGGLAQIISSGLQDRRAHRAWRRDKRAEAYAEYVAAVRTALLRAGGMRPHTDPRENAAAVHDPVSYAALNRELQPLRARIDLYGSKELAGLARWPIQHVTLAVEATVKGDPATGGQWLERAGADLANFTAAARRDLGVE